MVKFELINHSYINKKNATYGFNDIIDNIGFSVLQISGAEVALINGLRRIFMNNIPTYAFDTKNIDISTNNTQYHIDLIKERMSFIVIDKKKLQHMLDGNVDGHNGPNGPNSRIVSVSDLTFHICDADNMNEPLINTTQNIIKLHAIDNIKIFNKKTGSFIQNDGLIVYNSLLLTLRPKEKIHLQMFLSIGIGETHTRWQSSITMMKYATNIDEEDVNVIESNKQLQDYIKHDDDTRKPHKILLIVESVGKMSSIDVINEGFKAIKKKIITFKNKLDASVDETLNRNDDGGVEETKGEWEDDTFETNNPVIVIYMNNEMNIPNMIKLKIENEGHTLGNILRAYCLSYLLNHTETNNNIKDCLVSYRVPHPLKNEIEILLKTNERIKPIKLLYKSIDNILKDLNKFTYT